MEKLIEFLMNWADEKDFQFSVNTSDEEKEIDFININIKTKTIYIGELDINEELVKD